MFFLLISSVVIVIVVLWSEHFNKVVWLPVRSWLLAFHQMYAYSNIKYWLSEFFSVFAQDPFGVQDDDVCNMFWPRHAISIFDSLLSICLFCLTERDMIYKDN